jgi:hypothetical protein
VSCSKANCELETWVATADLCTTYFAVVADSVLLCCLVHDCLARETELTLPNAATDVVSTVIVMFYLNMLSFFVPGSSVVNMEKELGFKQSFLRGHAAPVGLIEVRAPYCCC